jgi:uncharacterized integral membrane protein
MENSEKIMMGSARNNGVWWVTIALMLFFLVITGLLVLGTGLGMFFIDDGTASFGIGVVFTLAVVFGFIQLFMKSGTVRIKR